jgi:hypothetical protein
MLAPGTRVLQPPGRFETGLILAEAITQLMVIRDRRIDRVADRQDDARLGVGGMYLARCRAAQKVMGRGIAPFGLRGG